MDQFIVSIPRLDPSSVLDINSTTLLRGGESKKDIDDDPIPFDISQFSGFRMPRLGKSMLDNLYIVKDV
jgi:hypothetical protein